MARHLTCSYLRRSSTGRWARNRVGFDVAVLPARPDQWSDLDGFLADVVPPLTVVDRDLLRDLTAGSTRAALALHLRVSVDNVSSRVKKLLERLRLFLSSREPLSSGRV